MPDSLKPIAIRFLQLTARGDVDAAFENIANGFLHHNPYFASDAASLKKAMAENARMHPAKRFEVLRALQDGDLVAVHSRARLTADGPDIALAHLFRFADRRIAELWDIGQPAPENMANQAGMF